ncbi:hypothetical protein [Conexibacter sp. SYSU D00693]|uniref:hypothetical protein n=1 Tax=Conexibacter sp. SYSU D00693 TaxID=2812560 RepID=UPI00196A3B0D|nr:hypothetical protein [Conexibacter sp. SYSU D00693]
MIGHGRGARLLAGTAAVAACAAIAGCGGDDGGDDEPSGRAANASERQGVEQTVNAWYDALGRGDAQGACDQLTPEAQKAGGASCIDTLNGLLKATPAASRQLIAQSKLSDVKVADDGKATAVVSQDKKVAPSGEDRLELSQSGGRWLISNPSARTS